MIENIQNMIVQAGTLRDPEMIARYKDTQWAICFQNDLIIAIEYIENKEQLVLFSEIGKPGVQNQLHLYQTILVFNSLYKDNEGMALGLDELNGNVIMTVKHPANQNVPEFVNSLERFHQQVLNWKSIIENDQDSQQRNTKNNIQDLQGFTKV